MVLLPIRNWAGNQPIHDNIAPPTAVTFFLLGIRLSRVTPNFEICCGPARHIPAPLSGNIIMVVALAGLVAFGNIGVMLAGISWILVLVAVY